MKILRSKIFKTLSVLLLIGIVIGIIYFIITMDKQNTNNDFINLLYSLEEEKVNFKTLLSVLIYNTKYYSYIWISGIIFILIFLVPLIVVFKGILIGYLLTNIIIVFGIKGIIICLILATTTIINTFIILLISYYSLNNAYKTYLIIKKEETINLKKYIKKYLLIYIILLLGLIISTTIEIYVGFNIIKLLF